MSGKTKWHWAKGLAHIWTACTAAVFLLAAAAAAQPVPFRVEVSATRNWVLSGRTVQLEARGLGRFGERIHDIPWTWASSNPVVAEVSETGEVRGRAPGRAEIEASFGGVAGVFAVLVQPLRIEVNPPRLELEAGDEARLEVRAVDADGKAIAAAAPVQWSSTLGGVVSVEGGRVRGVLPGTVTVTARLSLGPGASYTGQAIVQVRRRSDYRIEKIIDSTYTFPSAELRLIGDISYSGDRMAFVAALSTGSQALFFHDGTLRLLAVSGRVLEAAGSTIMQIDNASVNSRGDVLAQIQVQGMPTLAVLFPGGRQPGPGDILTNPPPSQGCICCLNVRRRSLGDDGAMLVPAWDCAAQRGILLYRHPDGRIETLPTGNLPDLGPGGSFGGNAILAGPRRAVFEANSPGRSGWFEWNGERVRRIAATGDSILGRLVNFIGFEGPAAPPDGNVYFRMGGPGWNGILRWRDGAWSNAVEQNRQYGNATVNNIWRLQDASNDAVLFDGGSSDGGGVYRLRAGTLESIALNGPPPQRTWMSTMQAILARDGSVIVHGSQQGVASRVARVAGGVTTTLAQSGVRLEGPFSLVFNWSGLGEAGDSDSRVARVGWGTVLRVSRTGATTLLGPGDPLPEGGHVMWIGDFNTNSRGEWIANVGTTQENRLYAGRNGRVEALLRANGNLRLPNGQFVNNFNGGVALNGRGQFTAFVNAEGTNHLVLFSPPGAPRIVLTQGTPAPGGGTFNLNGTVSLDETGRVLFLENGGPNVQYAYLWENGQVRRVLRSGDQAPAGFIITGMQARAAGDRFLISAGGDQGAIQILALDAAGIRAQISTGDRLSFGGTIQWFHFSGNPKASATGDLVFMPGLTGGGPAVVVRGRNGVDRLVAQSNARIATGEWIGALYDAAVTERGEVFFTASPLSGDNRIGLYRATPK